MDNKKFPTGVRPKRGQIELWYCLPGQTKKHYEYIEAAPTDANLKKAGITRRKIIEEIKLGIFDPKKHFPNSRNASQIEHNQFYFSDYAQKWLDAPDNDWLPQTRDKYLQILQDVWQPNLYDKSIENITYIDLVDCLESTVEDHEDRYERSVSASTYNNWLTCIRGPFELATRDPACPLRRANNPALEFTNKKRIKTTPDPLTVKEMQAIIADIQEHEGEYWACWFELGFFTGIRVPSEMNPLTWADVDFEKRELSVNKKWTQYHGIQKGTKTKINREVYLNDPSLNTLHRLKQISISITRSSLLFTTADGEPVQSPNMQRKMWLRSLERLEIRHRSIYHMRHTFATLCLMDGLNAGYVASQLGHSEEVFHTKYARWINTIQNTRQQNLLNAAFARHFGENGDKAP